MLFQIGNCRTGKITNITNIIFLLIMKNSNMDFQSRVCRRFIGTEITLKPSLIPMYCFHVAIKTSFRRKNFIANSTVKSINSWRTWLRFAIGSTWWSQLLRKKCYKLYSVYFKKYQYTYTTTTVRSWFLKSGVLNIDRSRLKKQHYSQLVWIWIKW